MYKDGKLGIPMIKRIVDDVTYSHEKGMNKLVLLKYIKHEPYEVKGENNEN
jgi:anti-sigma regulatory factor (Ser/Thr protein kinase)